MPSLLNIGTRAMAANQAVLQTIGNNISNVNTPGYSRQEVQLASSGGQYTGSGFYGNGVQVQTIVRSSNAFLTREAALTRSQAAADTTLESQLTQLEKLFTTGSSSIGQAGQEVLNAFADVATQPKDTSARQVVLSRAEEFASRMRSAGSQIDTLQAGVNADLKNSVDQVNRLAAEIAKVNQKIASYRGSEHAPNDLLDQRDTLINDLSEYVQVTTIPAEDGTLGVFVGGSQRLVLGNQAETLQVVADTFDASKSRVGIVESGGVRTLDGSVTQAGGTIAGLLSFQDKDLVDARNMLGQIAAAFAARVNQQQSYGLDLRTPQHYGDALFSEAEPRVLPASTNATGAAASSVSLTISDATQLQASDYRLEPSSTAGQYTVTRLSDNKSFTLASGGTFDGLTLNVTTPGAGMAATDKFLLQPVATAASGLQRVLDDPTGIAAASPIVATPATANAGTATVASLALGTSPSGSFSSVNIYFSGTSGGSASYAIYDSSVTLPPSASDVPLATGTWSAGQPITYNDGANQWKLSLNGVPATGDKISVAPNDYWTTNNGNATAMLALRDEGFVGRQDLGGGSLAPGQTVTGAYAEAMSDIGVRVQSANGMAEISGSIASEAEAAVSNETGVNLDEEAARLIQFQQSYQAAAKVLQAAQKIFDTLLSLGG
ncbi:MAG: flagellar hook-associated protein FlgK [Pseudomonadota bacterium]